MRPSRNAIPLGLYSAQSDRTQMHPSRFFAGMQQGAMYGDNKESHDDLGTMEAEIHYDSSRDTLVVFCMSATYEAKALSMGVLGSSPIRGPFTLVRGIFGLTSVPCAPSPAVPIPVRLILLVRHRTTRSTPSVVCCYEHTMPPPSLSSTPSSARSQWSARHGRQWTLGPLCHSAHLARAQGHQVAHEQPPERDSQPCVQPDFRVVCGSLL